MSKPVVHYREGSLAWKPKVGNSVILQTLDHTSPRVVNYPESDGAVWTSQVTSVGKNGEFETENTHYKPKKV